MATKQDDDLRKLGWDVSSVSTHYLIKVKIKNIEFYPQKIQSLVIREWIFNTLPYIDIIMTDDGTFTELFPFEDNDVITVEISKNKDRTSPIALEFTLLDYTIENTDVQKIIATAIRISGVLKTKSMFFPIKDKSFPRTTSVSVLEDIGTENGLKVDSRINTSDNMTWLQLRKCDYDMITHVLHRAYKENDCIFAFTNRKNEFVITSLNKELDKTQFWKTQFSPDRMFDDNKPKDDSATPNSKTQEEIDDDSNKTIYFSNYVYYNFAGTTNKEFTYGVRYGNYDLTGNLIEDNVDSNNHKLTDYSYKEKDGDGSIVSYILGGFKYDQSNTHDNYTLARIQNKYLMEEFFSGCMVLYVNPTDHIKLMDKINLILPSMLDSKSNNIYSGEWLIGGITHSVTKNGTYKMVLILFRNGINKSTEMKAGEMRLSK
jgi:hypothetical protein